MSHLLPKTLIQVVGQANVNRSNPAPAIRGEVHLQAPRRGGDAHGPKAHDGTIDVRSGLGSTEFVVRLPGGSQLAHSPGKSDA